MGNKSRFMQKDVIYMPTIKDRTRKNIERSVGLSLSEITSLSLDDEIKFVERKTGKKVVFSKEADSRKMIRGNALLALGRIMTMREVDRKLDKIK